MAAKKKAGGVEARIAKKLGAIEGVVAVAAASWPTPADVTLLVYYRAEAKPAMRSLRELAESLDDAKRPEAVADFGDWGPWANGGARLKVDGKRVEWAWRELGHVAQTIGEARAGRLSFESRAGRPHGFHGHAYLGEIARATPLFDGAKLLSQLQALAASYPPALRKAIVDRWLFEAELVLDAGAKAPKRGDVAFVAGALSLAAAALVQVVFALNRRYFADDFGALAEAADLDIAPKKLGARVEALLAAPGSTPAKLARSLEAMRELVEETRALAKGDE